MSRVGEAVAANNSDASSSLAVAYESKPWIRKSDLERMSSAIKLNRYTPKRSKEYIVLSYLYSRL